MAEKYHKDPKQMGPFLQMHTSMLDLVRGHIPQRGNIPIMQTPPQKLKSLMSFNLSNSLEECAKDSKKKLLSAIGLLSFHQMSSKDTLAEIL